MNKAYDGLTISRERYYKVSFYARPVIYEGNLRVAIVQGEKIITEQNISVKEGHCWNQYQLELHVDQEVSGGDRALRAKMGHESPFHLEMIGVGEYAAHPYGWMPMNCPDRTGIRLHYAGGSRRNAWKQWMRGRPKAERSFMPQWNR